MQHYFMKDDCSVHASSLDALCYLFIKNKPSTRTTAYYTYVCTYYVLTYERTCLFLASLLSLEGNITFVGINKARNEGNNIRLKGFSLIFSVF